MGVPGFSTWFTKKAAPEAFVPLHVGRHSFDHVYVDLASVLHGVLRNGMLSRSLALFLAVIDICQGDE